MPSKAELRAHFRQQRQNLSPEAIAQATKALSTQLINHPKLKHAQKIGAYLPFNNELNPLPGLKLLAEHHKKIFMPILHPWRSTFWFAPWQQQVRKNKWGILEPIYQIKNLQAPWDLDVILVPLLAVDNQGHRLGMGKGCYDQSLAFKKANSQEKPYLIGCAYDFQVSNTPLPHEHFDIGMNEIIQVKN